MHPSPRITVVIPLYNKEAHITRAIESVMAQPEPPHEIVVVDDGSTDRGAEQVEALRFPHVRLIRQENAGVSAARNRGVAEATGDFIAFLDADDCWKPEFLGIVRELIRLFPEAGLFATNYLVQTAPGQQRPARIVGLPGSDGAVLFHDFFSPASAGEFIHVSATCAPKALIEEAGGFPVGETMGEDQDLWTKICLRRPFAFAWDIGSVYHQDAENRAMSRIVPEEELPFCRRLQASLDRGEIPGKLVPGVTHYLAAQLLYVAMLNAKSRRYKKALHLLRDKRTAAFPGRRWLWIFKSLAGVVIFRS